jgi:hypothetical protein
MYSVSLLSHHLQVPVFASGAIDKVAVDSSEAFLL